MNDSSFHQHDSSSIISETTDNETYQKIVSILCAKRKTLEETINQTNTGELKELIEEMKTFGISEIDYQKYLVIEARKTSTQTN